MAEVVTRHTVPVNSHQFGGVAAPVKRKTPSELRGEQLKRKHIIEIVDESAAPLVESFKGATGLKKPEPKIPKLVDTRLGDIYQVKKSRLQLLSAKENVKKQENLLVEKNCSMNNLSIFSKPAAIEKPAVCGENPLPSSVVAKDDTVQGCATADQCNKNKFRHVASLSRSGEGLSGPAIVDMDKALKGLAASKFPVFASDLSDSSKWHGNLTPAVSTNSCPVLSIPGQNPPLDLTLKTYMRVVSSTSVTWFHRSIMGSTYNGMAQFFMQKGEFENQELSHVSGSTCSSPKGLYSWVYPQSPLPAPVISALTAVEGGDVDFLRKRHSAWEDAFRSLYYMLRKNACNLFYVCTAQFVVMFTSSTGKGEPKSLCSAYISKSTRGLRSLLKEYDVGFSMPLCPSRVEEFTMEDLVDLSELEKQNVGQTRRLSSSNVDGTPKSLLVFDGNQNVHGLYEFMLNYRSFFSSLTVVDVPMLYSPVTFQNACLHIPEIQCKELKKLDNVSLSLKGFNTKIDEDHKLPSGVCYSVEVKDVYLPPWITYNLCAIMGSEGREFEASFNTESTSVGFNVALETVSHISEEEKGSKDSISAFGVADAVVASEMGAALLKGLKYSDGFYSASLSPV